MQKTSCGEEAVKHPQIRNMLYDLAVMHVLRRDISPAELSWLIRSTIATYLAAVPIKRGVGFRAALGDQDPAKNEIDGLEEFIVEQADIINPIAEDVLAMAEIAHAKVEGRE